MLLQQQTKKIRGRKQNPYYKILKKDCKETDAKKDAVS